MCGGSEHGAVMGVCDGEGVKTMRRRRGVCVIGGHRSDFIISDTCVCLFV